MTTLERRYRRLLLAYPRRYRRAHGDELLDVLMESSEPGRTFPAAREGLGLLLGGLRTRVIHQADGRPWTGGVHLGVTALATANFAALLPYAGSIPLWALLSGLALLAVLRGRVWPAIALTLVTGAKAVAIAGGWRVFELTLVPVYPSFLTDAPLFSNSSSLATAGTYALTLFGLLVLAARPRAVRPRSWWWPAAVPLVAWAGPPWMLDERPIPISLSKLFLELALFALAVAAGYLTRDPRWALASAIYLLATSLEFGLHAYSSDMFGLSEQHLAYWGLLGLLTVAAAFVPYRQRRHCLD